MKHSALDFTILNDAELFQELKSSEDPHKWLSYHSWHQWCNSLISSKYAQYKMCIIANGLDMDWPFNRNREKVKDYLYFNFGELFRLSQPFRKKIILCIAALIIFRLDEAETAGEYATLFDNYRYSKKRIFDDDLIDNNCKLEDFFDKNKLYNSDIFKSLYCSNKPVKLLQNDTWESWNKCLKNSIFRQKNISSISMLLGMNWPIQNKGEIFSDYVSMDLSEIRRLAQDVQKVLIVCIAAIAISDYDSLSTKRDYEEITDKYGIFGNDINRFYKHLSVSLGPDALVTQELWEEWGETLAGKNIYTQPISVIAKKNRLRWNGTKRDLSYLHF